MKNVDLNGGGITGRTKIESWNFGAGAVDFIDTGFCLAGSIASMTQYVLRADLLLDRKYHSDRFAIGVQPWFIRFIATKSKREWQFEIRAFKPVGLAMRSGLKFIPASMGTLFTNQCVLW